MRRIAFFICCFLLVNAQAQTEHLKFMGIPLNGTINQFQAKLSEKEIKPDVQLNKEIPAGCRAFTGVFSGDDAMIFVYYNTKTKVVYRAKAVIECVGIKNGKEKFEFYKNLLNKKYADNGDGYGGNEVDYPNYPTYLFIIYDRKLDQLGSIGLYIRNSEYGFIDNVYLHIDYEDRINSVSNDNNNMDDL